MELEFDISATFFFPAQWDHQLLECQDHLHYRALKWAFCLSDLRQLVVMRSLAQAEMNLMKALKHTQPLCRRFERVAHFSSSLDSGNYPRSPLSRFLSPDSRDP